MGKGGEEGGIVGVNANPGIIRTFRDLKVTRNQMKSTEGRF